MNSTTFSSIQVISQEQTSHLCRSFENEENSSFTSSPLFLQESIKDRFIIELISRHILRQDLFLLEEDSFTPIFLREKALISLIELLDENIQIEPKKQLPPFNFTLFELLEYFLDNKHINNIELIGGSVPFILKNCISTVLQNIGLQSSEKLIEHATIHFGQTFADIDLRITGDIPLESLTQILYEFILQKIGMTSKRQVNHEGERIVHQTCFSKFFAVESQYAIIGFQNLGGKDLDLILVKELPRESLFIRDALRIPLIPLLEARKRLKNSTEMIKSIQRQEHLCDIQLKSEMGYGQQSIIDHLSGILRAHSFQTINHLAWFSLLMNYQRGNRCLTSELEQILLKKLFNFIQTREIKECFFLEEGKEEESLPYWHRYLAQNLQKTFQNHCGDDAVAATFMIIQASLSLNKLGKQEGIDPIWKQIRNSPPSFLSDEKNPLSWIDQLMMSSISNPFSLVTSFLEVQAFLFLNSSSSHGNQDRLHACLIFHQGKPTIQLAYANHYLLLPFEPLEALQRLLTFENELINHFDVSKVIQKVEDQLFPPSPFIGGKQSAIGRNLSQLQLDLLRLKQYAQDLIEKKSCRFFRKIVEKYLLACQVHTSLSLDAKWIERHFSNFLENCQHISDYQLLLISAQNGTPNQMETPYRRMLSLLSNMKKRKIPLLLWSHALILTATEDGERGFIAYQVWHKIHFSSDQHKKYSAWIIEWIGDLAITRPDLSLKILKEMPIHHISFEQSVFLLNRLHSAFQAKSTWIVKSWMISPFIKLVEKWQNHERKNRGDSQKLLDIVYWLFLSFWHQEDMESLSKLAYCANVEIIGLLKHPKILGQIAPQRLWLLFANAIKNKHTLEEVDCQTLIEIREHLTLLSLNEEMKREVDQALMEILEQSHPTKWIMTIAKLAVEKEDFARAFPLLLNLIKKKMDNKTSEQAIRLILKFLRTINPIDLYQYLELLSHPSLYKRLKFRCEQALLLFHSWVQNPDLTDQKTRLVLFSQMLKLLPYAPREMVITSMSLLCQFLISSWDSEIKKEDLFIQVFEEGILFLNQNEELELLSLKKKFKKKLIHQNFSDFDQRQFKILQKCFQNSMNDIYLEKNNQGIFSLRQKNKRLLKLKETIFQKLGIEKIDETFICRTLFFTSLYTSMAIGVIIGWHAAKSEDGILLIR